jgi:hypothetical protein
MSVSGAHQLLQTLLPKFILHECTRKQQAASYRAQKENIGENEAVIHFDFAENYSCSHQDATQAAYWCQNQVTLFTVAVYCRDGMQLHAIISDCLEHTKVAISVFLAYLLEVRMSNVTVN